MAGDGQVTLGQEVLKGLRQEAAPLYNDKIIAGIRRFHRRRLRAVRAF
jgi:ATP-dependent protease HslVU (ClpYQ) peptidase subunit